MGQGLRISASGAVGLVLAGGFLMMLAYNMPGHMSVDTVLNLWEGRMRVRETFAPAVYGLILRVFDRFVPGTGLYVVASGVLLYGALALTRTVRGRVSWLAVPVALAIVLTPQLMIYQGIVWRDVLFANFCVAAFIALAYAGAQWERPTIRWLGLLAAVLLMGVAALVRQNGLIAVVMAAVVVGWTARVGGWRSMLGYGAGFLVAALILAQAVSTVAQPRSAGPDKAMGVGLRILQHYDIVGAVARDPQLKLEEIDKIAPARDDVIHANAKIGYSPERVDFLDRAPALGPNLWPNPTPVIQAEWRDIIVHHTDVYLAHRIDVFRWVFLTPELDKCVPLHVGVDGPPVTVAALKLVAGQDQADGAAYAYAQRFFGTPVYSHLTYAVIAALVVGVLLLRRDPADMAIVGLQLAALGFTASFFLISIACDYRYLYLLDLSALAGLLYVAVDPPWRGRKAAA